MANGSNGPTIIKRKKVSGGDGHHGGAWKVAYADFVTAMMAFFLLMWLLNATTEQQRKGLADYFSPTIAVARVSGGGDGMFGGDSMMAEDTLANNGSGEPVTIALPAFDETSGGAEAAAEVAALQDIEAQLLGIGGESLVRQEALRHVVTRLTDEGLIIEIFAREGAPLFVGQTTEPTPVLIELTGMFARVFPIVTNPVAIEGHTRGLPLVVADHPVWDISTGRSETVRRLMEAGNLDPKRIARITGHADRDLAVQDSLSVRNDRIEITLLRTER